jgi:toxin ParE1/3/4
MNNVTKREAAKRDLEEIFVYLGETNVDTALDFLFAAEQTFELLAKMPQLGSHRRFQPTNLFKLRQFPVDGYAAYLIFYEPTADGIEVVRVLHGKRDIDTIFAKRL